LYRDKTKFSTTDKDVAVGAPKWPAGKEHTDANFGTTTVYFDQVEIPVPLKHAKGGVQTLALTANFQGCKEHSVCYPVMERTIDVALPAGATDTTATSSVASVATPTQAPQASASTSKRETISATAAGDSESQEDYLTRVLREASLPLIWFAFFVAGLGL